MTENFLRYEIGHGLKAVLQTMSRYCQQFTENFTGLVLKKEDIFSIFFFMEKSLRGERILNLSTGRVAK